MGWKEGDVYVCAARCGCEVTVTRAGPGAGDRPPTCCCGHGMVRKRPTPPFVVSLIV